MLSWPAATLHRHTDRCAACRRGGTLDLVCLPDIPWGTLSHSRVLPHRTRAKWQRAMSRLHSLLRKKKTPDKCGFCHIVIVKDDRHSGVFYKVPPSDGEDEGGTIHQVGDHYISALVHLAHGQVLLIRLPVAVTRCRHANMFTSAAVCWGRALCTKCVCMLQQRIIADYLLLQVPGTAVLMMFRRSTTPQGQSPSDLEKERGCSRDVKCGGQTPGSCYNRTKGSVRESCG